MTDNPLRLAVIVGSIRPQRFGPTVAQWFVDIARRRDDLEIDHIDLSDFPVGAGAPSMTPPEDVVEVLGELSPRLEAADGFVVVTPEYNHSYPASLKAAIDWHQAQFHAKPVAFVCYGGISGGLRAVEHLRGVFAELHAVTTRDTVSFQHCHGQFDPQGQPVDTEGPAGAAKALLDQVTWWARALKDAKAKTPYGE
ncbi:NADPH-dependent FMN reductase [Streptomyces sp. NPDC055189]